MKPETGNPETTKPDAGKPEGGKREAKKAALKEKLLNSAKTRIEASGFANLRARDVTSDAGCALGALYNAYDDLDMLVLHVNSSTLAKLGQTLEAVAGRHSDPVEKLVALALGYLGFACDNQNLWAALFDHRMPDGVSVPNWHLEEHFVLFEQIALPVKELKPELPDAEVEALSRALFAAVHGIVSLSLQERFIAVPRTQLEKQLSQIVLAMVKGLG